MDRGYGRFGPDGEVREYRTHPSGMERYARGCVIKIAGSASDVQSALQAGKIAASSFFPHATNGNTTTLTINRPDEQALRAILSPNEISALIEQPVVENSFFQ